MSEAPERIWADVEWGGYQTEDVAGGPNDDAVEYVRADLYAALEQEKDRADRLECRLLLVTANRDHLLETTARLREAVQEIDRTKIGFDDNPHVVGYLCNKGAIDEAIALVAEQGQSDA